MIQLHRSNRAEVLVDALCRVIQTEAPDDPFAEYPIVVGSRGMERWLRHEIATRTGIAARLAFPFPRQAFVGAGRWLLDPERAPLHDFWAPPPGNNRPFDSDRLTFSVAALNRKYSEHPAFGEVSRYLELGESTGALSSRELLFAEEVSGALSRLLVDRSEDALRWARTPESAPGAHRWLALLLRELGGHTHPDSPALLPEQLKEAAPQVTGRSLCVFGLSTMSPGDRTQLLAISQSLDVHLFVLSPTRQWIEDTATPREASARRRKATTDAERAAVEAEIADTNPLLASLAAPSRDLQSWLEENGYEDGGLVDHQTVSGEQPTLLQRVQDAILDAEPFEPIVGGVDGSIQLHRAYGAMRQCEVLHNQLLALMKADADLQARDIVVMTPDIQTYAPLVAAVFGRRSRANTAEPSRLPAIPVAIADLGLRKTNPIAEVLLSLLVLAGERLTATWLLDFLALSPVRERWQLDEHLSDLRTLIGKAGFRWGEDAADRMRVGQPAFDQNTARFALERLALGVMMPDEDPTRATLAADNRFGPAVALEVCGRDRVALVGKLAEVLGALRHHRAQLMGPATLEVWVERMMAALDDLTATTSKAGWLRGEVRAALEALGTHAEGLGAIPVERQGILRWLAGRFELPQRGDRVISGAVQVCALEPMRSVPFKVVALLGMDDGAFPRSSRWPTWDPMEQERRRGERDRREVDRHLLLEAILSARQHLLVLWSGFDVQQGKEQPAAVPIEELREVLTRVAGDEIVQKHPLQPWSPENFSKDLISFDQTMAEAASTLRGIASGSVSPCLAGLEASRDQALPPEQTPLTQLDLSALARGLAEPQKMLLWERLSLWLDEASTGLANREPLELDNLDTWDIKNRLLLARLESSVSDDLVARVGQRLQGEGKLPLRAGGARILHQANEEAVALYEQWCAVAGEPAPALELSQVISGIQLLGRVEQVREHGGQLLLQWVTPSSEPKAWMILSAWLHLLVGVLNEYPVDGARLVSAKTVKKSRKGVFIAAPQNRELARQYLETLLAVWQEARTRPIPLFPKTSRTLADHLNATKEPSKMGKALADVRRGWLGTRESRGDYADRWIRAFYKHYDPTAHLDATPGGLCDLARRVWLPIKKQSSAEHGLAERWSAEEGAR